MTNMSDRSNYINSDPNDFLSKYLSISNKLKKRFLRKPNVSEASDQFEILALDCEHKELHRYAGTCWLAAARCQGTIGNSIPEINLLMKAGREFLLANKKRQNIGSLIVDQVDLQDAVNAFNHAIARCESQEGFRVMSSSLAVELARTLGPKLEGIEYLCKSIQIHPTVQAINMLASFYMKHGDYVSALQALTELVEMIENHPGSNVSGNYKNVLHRCEISRVLLLLILRPTPQRLAPSLAQVLEKYAWADDAPTPVPNLTEDEMLLLQSLVLACQSRDYEALLELEDELWPYLNTEQKELLQHLVQIFNSE
ncbi:hypothetical protein QAD02_024150 [Eretmocerus hayati]|uniref:Uncharacterized protein n=2 Tax=Eretmocerus hayati TaxID=131215 RepID=A0ACC2PY72_9HYME|nr:hypothetical protein QAD02_024144 [Eretmocerus hayati]KAJ8688355.1 hypothetical protein QAD02_024150 [Eretmocerus hayati]